MQVFDAGNAMERQEISQVKVSANGAVEVKREKVGQETAASGTSPSKEKTDDASKIAALLEISQAGKTMWEKRQEEEKEQDSVNDLAKIIEISRRISRGDKVPYTDEKKLMEYSMVMYQMAKSLAIVHENEKHKKHKALFDEEEEQKIDEQRRDLDTGGNTVDSGSPSAPESAPAEGGSSTGGE